MILNTRFLKSFNSIVISAGLLGLVPYVNPAKAETPDLCKDKLTQTTTKKNIFTEDTTGAKAAFGGGEEAYCLGSPDKFELTIFEMGLCTENPISGDPKVFSKDNCVTTMSSQTVADLAGKTVNLPSADTRPANASYTYAYIVILNEFGLKGSISLGGTVYYSNSTGGVDNNIDNLSDHTEILDSFDNPDFIVDFGPYDMPTGGKVSALLTDGTLTRALNNTDVSRLVAVFETNAGSPVVISDSVNGVEVELQVADGGYGVSFVDGVPVDFGSAPFKPVFTTF